MQHLNPYLFYELAAKLHAVFDNANQNRVSDMFGPLSEAQALLDEWIKGDLFPIETSKDDATRLLNKLGGLFNKYFIDPTTKQLKNPTGEDRIDTHEMAMVGNMLEKFEHALAAELAQAPVYAAQKRGIYSTYDLIENAKLCLSEETRALVPEAAQNEFNVAGRALAFGLGTAAAMHLLRAVEIVLKEYYELFSGTTVAKTERSYSIYLKKLASMADDDTNNVKPDKRLLQMLAQIKEHYRNPLTSPDKSISVGQATSLFALATAIITLMGEQITERQAEKAQGGKAKSALSKVAEAAEAGSEEEESYSFGTKKAG